MTEKEKKENIERRLLDQNDSTIVKNPKLSDSEKKRANEIRRELGLSILK